MPLDPPPAPATPVVPSALRAASDVTVEQPFARKSTITAVFDMPPEQSTSMKRSSQTVVLLDGDADFFHSTYLSQGFLGGTRAAIALYQQVRGLIATREPYADSTTPPDILALVFLNVSGLENYLRIPLRSFIQGFNCSPFPMSAVDSGNRPQSADECLKNYLTFHIYTCDHLIMGGTHDGGYAATLHRLDPELVQRKIILLRTTPFLNPRLADFRLPEAHFPGLFDGRDPRGPGYTLAGSQKMPQSPARAAALTPPRTASLPAKKQQGPDSGKKPPPRAQAIARRTRSSTPRAFSSTFKKSRTSIEVPAKYRPLVDYLLELHQQGDVRPLRASLGTQIGMLNPRPYTTSFKTYAAQAEKAGIVRFSISGTGVETIELAIPAAQLRKSYAPKPPTPPLTPPASPPRLPTSTSPSRPFALPKRCQVSATSSSSAKEPMSSLSTAPPLGLPPRPKPPVASSPPPPSLLLAPALPPTPDFKPFQPLLVVLRQQAQLGNRSPRCAFVQTQVSQFGAEHELYDRGGEGAKTWDEYVNRAEIGGLVKTGGESEEQWISLK